MNVVLGWFRARSHLKVVDTLVQIAQPIRVLPSWYWHRRIADELQPFLAAK